MNGIIWYNLLSDSNYNSSLPTCNASMNSSDWRWAVITTRSSHSRWRISKIATAHPEASQGASRQHTINQCYPQLLCEYCVLRWVWWTRRQIVQQALKNLHRGVRGVASIMSEAGAHVCQSFVHKILSSSSNVAFVKTKSWPHLKLYHRHQRSKKYR